MPRTTARVSTAFVPKIPGKRRRLLANPKVREWYEGRCLRSALSADVDLRKLDLLLERAGLDPEQVEAYARGNPDELRIRLTRYAADLKRQGRLDTYIEKTFSGLRNYLGFRHVSFDGYPKLEPIQGASLERERVPTPEELGMVLERLTLRGRTIALLIAHAGLRPQVIGSYRGERGLKLGDLPELKLGRDPAFQQIPFVIRVPAALSKTRRAYVTFGTQQLATTLLAYLKARARQGESLDPDSPVVTANAALKGAASRHLEGARFRRGFLATTNVVVETARALHLSAPEGVTWRSYVLRSYCSTRLMLAEGNGRISRDLREAILGHDTGVAGRYHVGKRWGEDLLAEARREYANAAEFLETNAQTRMNVAAEFRRTLFAVAGLTEDEAAYHMNDSNDEVLALLRNRLLEREAAIPKLSNGNGNGNGHGTQKPVSLAEAEQLLTQGWTFVANFGRDRVLLQPPA
jgi:hypothetical protein